MSVFAGIHIAVRIKRRTAVHDDIDLMGGHDFEYFCAELLGGHGFV